MSADKAKRTLLLVDIPRDELAFRIMQKAVGLVPPPGTTWQEAKLLVKSGGAPEMWDIFLEQADAAVAFLHECIAKGAQPS